LSLRIGTRGSALALAQARFVASLLSGEIELVTLTTAGDVNRAAGDKSRWTGALEQALLAGEIDLAVHSAKDVPGEIAPGTSLVAAPPRADPRDVLVGAAGLDSLIEGSRVGTSALRRRAQLLAVRPDLEVVELRGNVDTRLRKLDSGDVDALVLAAAGLSRLGASVSSVALDFVPAPGQGTLALQARSGDDRAAVVNDPSSWRALLAERAAVVALGASCHTPVGVHADGARLRGFAGLPDGSEWVLDELDASPSEDAGRALAARMLAAGAGDLLARAAAPPPSTYGHSA
jgi:hydroxymethylbilane synthase